MVYLIAIQSAATVQQALDSTCQGSPSETPVTVAPTCQDALTTLAANAARCAPTAENPQLFCTGQCRGYYDAVVDNCDATVSHATQSLCIKYLVCVRMCVRVHVCMCVCLV